MSFIIRAGEKKDSQEILNLITELAIYEKEPDAVKTSIADLHRDGFGENKFFKTFVCELEGCLVGFSLYFYTWSTWEGRPSLYLEDLFVLPEHRGQGMGLALLKKLAETALRNSCKRMDWAVLDWNKPAIDFYDSIGAKHQKEWFNYRLEGNALDSFAKK